MTAAPSFVQKCQEENGLRGYLIHDPHPPEIPAFQRKFCPFYAMAPEGGVNSKTVPILILHEFKEFGPSKYVRELFRFLTKRLNVLIFTVDYLGTKLRGAKLPYRDTIDEDTKALTRTILLKRGYSFADVEKLSSINDTMEALHFVAKLEQGKSPSQESPLLYGCLKVPDDHYDYGLISAIDCLWAIRILMEDYGSIDWSALSTVAPTFSGVVATQCTRLAPNSFALCMTESSGVRPPLAQFIKGGYFRGMPLDINGNRFRHRLIYDSYWSSDPQSAYYLSPDRLQIRTLDDDSINSQWRSQTNGPGALHFISHGMDESNRRLDEKEKYLANLRKLGMDVEFSFSEPHEIITALEFNQLNYILKYFKEHRYKKNPVMKSDFERRKKIVYECKDSRYIVDFASEYPALYSEPLANRSARQSSVANAETNPVSELSF